MLKMGVVGASGFTGTELLRLAAGHPDLEVVAAGEQHASEEEERDRTDDAERGEAPHQRVVEAEANRVEHGAGSARATSRLLMTSSRTCGRLSPLGLMYDDSGDVDPKPSI